MAPLPAGHLAVISDAKALAWILREGRMAFSSRRRKAVENLEVESNLLLYATSRCFRGTPYSGKSGVVGEVAVASPVTRLDRPVIFAGNRFDLGCRIQPRQLVLPDDMINLAPLVPQLNAFHGAWHLRLRAGFIPLDEHDCKIFGSVLVQASAAMSTAAEAYQVLADSQIYR